MYICVHFWKALILPFWERWLYLSFHMWVTLRRIISFSFFFLFFRFTMRNTNADFICFHHMKWMMRYNISHFGYIFITNSFIKNHKILFTLFIELFVVFDLLQHQHWMTTPATWGINKRFTLFSYFCRHNTFLF